MSTIVDELPTSTAHGRWTLASLPSIAPATLVPAGRRAVVVTPHPDGEVLATGGLIHGLHCLGRDLLVIAATGQAMSQGVDDPADKAGDRQVQHLPYSGALRRLGVLEGEPNAAACGVLHAGMAKNTLSDNETALAAFLAWHIRPGDMVFASWRFDGDPDYEALGRATLAAAAVVGAKCIPVPVRAWGWAVPRDSRVPWHRAHRIEVDQDGLQAKRQALLGNAMGVCTQAPMRGEPLFNAMHNPYEIVLL